MLLPFPASSAFSKGDLCCKKQLLEVISGEDPFFFCLTNQPFCAVWVQWRVTWNLQESYFKPLFFVPNVYEAKTWQGRGAGRSLSFTLLPLGLPWWITTLSCARCEALVFFNHRFHPSGGEMRLPNMSLLLSTRFLLESVMELRFFTSPFEILVHLKKIIWHLPGISVLVTRVWLEFWTPECPSLWPSEVQFIFHKMSLITHWYK